MGPDTNKLLTKSGKMLHTGPQMDVKPIKKVQYVFTSLEKLEI